MREKKYSVLLLQRNSYLGILDFLHRRKPSTDGATQNLLAQRLLCLPQPGQIHPTIYSASVTVSA